MVPRCPGRKTIPGEPLDELYGRIGDFSSRKVRLTQAALYRHMELSRRIGLRFLAPITFYNGPLNAA